MPDFVAFQASSPWVCFKFRENLVYFSSVPSHRLHLHLLIRIPGHASNLPQIGETGPGRYEVTAIFILSLTLVVVVVCAEEVECSLSEREQK